MAKLAKAPVLIAGDIDKGGVFASLYGTIMLLEEAERKYVKGTIINKFRGELKSLRPGLTMLEDLIHVPVIGVVPYLSVNIDDEDNLTERFIRKSRGLIDIAVVRLPRISNFTDFNALEQIECASVRYVTGVVEMGSPDLLIIPGTKNTIGDLIWMRENGLETAILEHVSAGKPVFGVCGGYQMLCETLSDPYGVEHGGEIKGLGLLKAATVFEQQKTRTRVTGTFERVGGIFKGLSGKHFEGYEIHMGQTYPIDKTKAPDVGSRRDNDAASLAFLTQNNSSKKPDGMHIGNIYGTYVHGIFDNEEVLHEIAEALMSEKGLSYTRNPLLKIKEYRETQYDMLADALRQALDMKYIYRVIQEGI